MTNLICTCGQQHRDWTAHYRLYSRDRMDERVLFHAVRERIQQALLPQQPLVVGLDDTVVRKTGTHISGVGWKRDPLGPAFQTNLVRGQRYLQFSAAWPLAEGDARLVPIGFHHAPSVPKPPRNATDEQRREHRQAQQQHGLSTQCLAHMKQLRADTEASRAILFSGDGGYTNQTLLRGLPAHCTYLGRLRKDAVLYHPPAGPPAAATGRRPSYGATAPTPEGLRTDDTIPWQTIRAYAAGKVHDFRIKTLGPVLWRKAGAGRPLRILVIAPLSYRLRRGAKLLYRQPAYLLCTDPDLPVEQVLQYYLWRWGIEVNFRDQKALVGTGEAQVRGAAANQHQPAASVAAYALLWIAALQRHRPGETITPLNRPKWRGAARSHGTLPSTGDLLRQLRYETWSGALRPSSFYHFVHPPDADTTGEKPSPSLPSALFSTA